MANDITFRTTAVDTSDVDTSASFLPRIFRTDTNKKFLHSTVHQLVQPGAVKKISGHVGRQYSKATLTDDVFIDSPTRNRQNYQLEPGFVIEDDLTNTVFLKDYQDYINQLRVFGANVSNHAKLNKQEFYSWSPRINWDKIVNFQNYYWLPHGPDVITIQNNASIDVTSTYTVRLETTVAGSAYIFSNDELVKNPAITLYRGQTYNFVIDSASNPFSIKTRRTAGTSYRYLSPLLTTDVFDTTTDSNGNTESYMAHAITSGVITFTVPLDAPNELAYVSELDVDIGGVFNILDLSDSGYINVTDEIIGKLTYSINNIRLSNGMKVQFAGNVFPSTYKTGRYYVEGVGKSIELINETKLQIVTSYTSTESMLFDIEGFDTTPFSDSKYYVTNPDYVVINRASADRNFWSRNNKWIHKDVINQSAEFNGVTPVYNEQLRASRPIIEFEKNLKLFNFGTISTIDVTVIDTTTIDVFSIVEGSLGYNVDGVNLKHGDHVIFTADLDNRVTNNIYRVAFNNLLHESSLQTISNIGTVSDISPTNIGWTAKITGMRTTTGLSKGCTISATNNSGKLGGGTIGNLGTATVTAIIDSTSIEYVIVGGDKPLAGSVTNIINVINRGQIKLIEIEKPKYNQVVLVQAGNKSQGQMYWYNGVTWNVCQQKTKSNQPPLFDLVNENGESFGDTSVYPGTSFVGTSIFSYKIGTGITDSKLGFPISYKNINNIGDIVFNFSLNTDEFNYELNDTIVSKIVDTGCLINYDNVGKISYINGWETCNVDQTQAAIRLYRNSNKVNNFDIDIFDYLPNLLDIEVRVYVNNNRSDNWVFKENTAINQYLQFHQIVFNTDLNVSDTVLIKVYSKLPINTTGYYEIPINLQNNPLNGVLSEFTLGEVTDHVNSIIDNVYNKGYIVNEMGTSNLRDLGSLSKYGTKFVQHSGPASLALYHITSESYNVIRAIDQSRDDYCKFKKTFLFVATTLGVDIAPVSHVNLILQHINKDIPNTSPYYFSDMAPYGSSVQTDYTVASVADTLFLLSRNFTLSALSSNAVGVYLNDEQLLHGKEYIFTDQGFVNILVQLAVGDSITIYEYESTDGCLIPETPTKLGIWPKYEPKIFLDTTLVVPRTMIQGHDGSLTLAYDDYRDDLILELEKRIYNNIKVQYNPNIFDIADIVPSYTRQTDYDRDQFNDVILPNFYTWLSNVGVDFSTPLSYDNTNPFTFNYSTHSAPDGRITPGYWRGIYQWMFDTDRPHICPWEMLGITEEPIWWTSVYGPAPYTKNNLVLWEDISKGLLKEPNKPVVSIPKYVRPFLMDHIPVDEDGKLYSPLAINVAIGYVTSKSVQSDFKFGDVSPVESAWRRHSHYPFSVLKTAILLNPAQLIGTLFDRSRIVVSSKTGQLIYSETGTRITPASITFPTVYLSSTRTQTAGLINYLINNINCKTLTQYDDYKFQLSQIAAKLCYRVGAFTSKEKFNLLLDSKSPTSVGSIFIPQEDYSLVLNASSPISIMTYSGVIITRVTGGYEIKGYSKIHPYFKFYPQLTSSGTLVTVGGISESFVEWESYQTYYTGSLVRYVGRFYRILIDHKSESTFNDGNYYLLSSLPIIGGISAYFKNTWDTTSTKVMPYGTKLETIQEVVDFLLGYGEWLGIQGFLFNEFNTALQSIENWETSAKEFMFWTAENWDAPSTTWAEWAPLITVKYGDVIRYNGEYYKALKDMQSAVFNAQNFYLLNGLNLDGKPVITLSPSANQITFKTYLSVVDDIDNPNNVYEILNANGDPITHHFINMFRIDNSVTYKPTSADGIYCASFYLMQREHVVVLNNTTMFNDTLYNPESGYKQDKIKVSGYVSAKWNGSMNAPGFIIDRAEISEWTPWKRYVVGDVVRYKYFYYSANTTLTGEELFNSSNWTKFDKKPTSKLLANWSYKAAQFTDFYSLDSDNFDASQQKYAQHLIGYQKRQYLENIIQDDVSEYKFYQGMIIEKGTQNVLNKLFDVLSASGSESLKFYEEWAIKTGQYGACSSFETIEFTLSESQFKINPQGFELVNRKDPYLNTLTIQQGITDIYLKPLSYTPNLWPAATPAVRSTVYAREDEVTFSVRELADLDISLVKHGNYILCTFTSDDWNVYQYFNRNLPTPRKITVTFVATETVDSVTYVHVTVDNITEITSGSIIGFKNIGDDGFYIVESVNVNDNIIIFKTDSTIVLSDIIEIGILYTRRTNRIDDPHYQNDDLEEGWNNNLKYLLWTDNDLDDDRYQDTSNWKVWQYNKVYELFEKNNTNLQISQYGRAITSSYDGKLVAVSYLANHGYDVNVSEVLIYQNINGSVWNTVQLIADPLNFQSNITVANVASVLAMSNNGMWLAVGSPTADVESQGSVSIYRRNTANIYVLTSTLVSPNPTSGEQFGKLLSFGTNLLVISTAIGNVYKFEYTLIPKVYTTYKTIGSGGTTIVVDSTNDILPGMVVSGKGLTDGQTVSSIFAFKPSGNSVSSTGTYTAVVQKTGGTSSGTGAMFTIIKTSTELSYNNVEVLVTNYGINYNIGSTIVIDGTLLGGISILNDLTLTVVNAIITSEAPTEKPAGQLTFSSYEWASATLTAPLATSAFGTSIDVSLTNTIAVSDPSAHRNVYLYNSTTADNNPLTITFLANMQTVGNSISLSNNGEYIAISNIVNSTTSSVSVFNTSVLTTAEQIILLTEFTTTYGKTVLFADDSATLIICSIDLNNQFLTAVDVYNRYEEKWVFSERNIPSLASKNIIATPTGILVGSPFSNDSTGKVYAYYKLNNEFTWSVKNISITKPNITKIKQAFLYNKQTNKLIKHLDIVDPVQDKHPIAAEQEIKYKSSYDPAVYSFIETDTTLFSLTNQQQLNKDDGIAWGSAHVGVLWWDVRTTKFNDNFTDSTVYRNSMLSTLATGASVDIYEWVETDLLPSEWDADADTSDGLALGISGTSLYGDNAYVEVKEYDTLSQQFSSTYYYWVKNKETISAITGRVISAANVSRLIANPKGVGYTYLSLTGLNSFSLVNAKSMLSNDDVILSIEYWTVDKIDQNIHTQWKVISTEPSTTIPVDIEQKWINSMCGKDENNRLVPDQLLPDKLKYGIENRPRQSMFINRFEAIKQVIEQTNLYLKTNLIVDTRNLTNLKQYDMPPTAIRGEYDVIIDTDVELRFVITKKYSMPSLSAEVVDGKIVNVVINSAGSGYINAPYVSIFGSGNNAVIRTIINEFGQITGVKIINGGDGYNSSTVLTVRSFSVLVSSDATTNGKWSIYSYVSNAVQWIKAHTYTYDTTKYWDYIDWYATGYNQFTTIHHLVSTYDELLTLNDKVGEVVKVTTTSSGRWALLKKHDLTAEQIMMLKRSPEDNWTNHYTVIGSQRGTIQFSSLLYNFEGTVVGYDGMLFDSNVYDNYASIELRNILTAIKDDLLIEDLKSNYLELFFSTVRYAISEQIYVDWIFKTSFVNVTHQVGDLHQSVTYKNDNLTNFEDYVDEVKPYKTKVREYISSYSKLDNTSLSITDFDLPPLYNSELKKVLTVDYSNSFLNLYPWKHWTDNLGCSVVDIKVVSQGSDYVTEPIVRIINQPTAVTNEFSDPVSNTYGATINASNNSFSTVGTVLSANLSGNIIVGDSVVGNGIPEGSTISHVSSNTSEGGITTFTFTIKFLRLTSIAKQVAVHLVFSPVSTATARAFVVNKQVSRIKLLTQGSSYTTTPIVEIIGGCSSTGIPAVAVPIMGNSVVRTADVKIKFDRTYQDYVIDDLQYTETFTSVSGTRVQFILKWPPDVIIGKSTVTINGIDEIRENYKLGTMVSIVNGYPVHIGVITFNTRPAANSNITVSYYKDSSILTATDRIHYFYQPQSGDLGNDLPQLMSGIDYGGVTVNGLGFDVAHGWDSMPYFTDTWDNFNPNLNDVKVTIGDTFFNVIKMPYVPTAGTRFNVYHKKVNKSEVRIDSSNYEVGVIDPKFPDVVMLTVVATGETDLIQIPSSIDAVLGDTIIIRNESSDGSIVNDYDTEISGGSIYNETSQISAMGSAFGVLPEDIIIDGDDLNSVMRGIGPEEVVPGQVVDALGIKVYNNEQKGAYMQFKDMLNQVRHIRLNSQKQTTLTKELTVYDTTIEVADVTVLTLPSAAKNIPGVIEINGERIEFLTFDNNVLGRLRRGTAGTGVPAVHYIDSIVQDISRLEYVPYNDDVHIEHIESDGTNIVKLSYAPTKSSSSKWKFSDVALSKYGQTDEIEVFVGGYVDSKIWLPNTAYIINDIIKVGSYVYKCIVNHTSSSAFTYDRTAWKYFIGNIRLKKQPYTVYNINEGEVAFDADFAVDGATTHVRLTELLSEGTIVTVVKRQGRIWDITDTEVNFIEAEVGSEYQAYKNSST